MLLYFVTAVKEAVNRAVQSCQYDNPDKKLRLSSAVLEALSGQKTMKAAAAQHDVSYRRNVCYLVYFLFKSLHPVPNS